MSYIGSQLERLDLAVDDRKGTVLNPRVYKVSIQFFSGGKKTNHISIEDGTLNRIFRVLQDEENVVRSNRRRGLRRNPNKNFAYHLAMESTERVKALVKEARRVKYKVRGSVADGIVEIISDDVPAEYVLTATKAPYGWSVRYNKEFWQG